MCLPSAYVLAEIGLTPHKHKDSVARLPCSCQLQLSPSHRLKGKKIKKPRQQILKIRKPEDFKSLLPPLAGYSLFQREIL
jgi:hypothetical protein